ncbi:MAG: DUF2267 domain-containing protein [Polyangiaceae bacterium]
METLTAQVKARAGLQTEREAKRAIQAAVGALRCALEEEDARSLAAALHPTMAEILSRAPAAKVDSLDAFYAEAERRERVGLGFAREHAQVVMQLLAEQLDGETLVRLAKRIPREIADLFTAKPVDGEAPPHVHVHPLHEPVPVHTLARSKPGTSEPISEAHGPLAHEGSVARKEAPYADDMVETAHSPRSPREDETLSGYRGGFHRK